MNFTGRLTLISKTTLNEVVKMLKLTFKLNGINPVDAMDLQYELSLNIAIYRVFINGYAKRGFVVFDEQKLPKEELLKMLEPYDVEVIREEPLTLEELVQMSVNYRELPESEA